MKIAKRFVCNDPDCKWKFIELAVEPTVRAITCGCGKTIREEKEQKV